MKYVEPQGDGETIDNATREAMISAITDYFLARRTTVDFES